jgi:hypothetical protein
VADKSLAVEFKTRGIYWPISIPTCPTPTRASAKNCQNQTGGEGGFESTSTILLKLQNTLKTTVIIDDYRIPNFCSHVGLYPD